MEKILLVVNGSLMRSLPLNKNLINAGAEFVCEDSTSAIYRMWSIGDQYPAMMKDSEKGRSLSLEIWELTAEGLVQVLLQELPGLCIGKIELIDNTSVLGVLGEPYICDGQHEITEWGGWREYISKQH